MEALSRTHYQVMGLAPTCDDVVIRAAYKALMFKYHPDQAEGDKLEAEHRTRAVIAAYGVLSDPVKRGDYDRELEALSTMFPGVRREVWPMPSYAARERAANELAEQRARRLTSLTWRQAMRGQLIISFNVIMLFVVLPLVVFGIFEALRFVTKALFH
jgi:curved DNA-binding protein CbpA